MRMSEYQPVTFRLPGGLLAGVVFAANKVRIVAANATPTSMNFSLFCIAIEKKNCFKYFGDTKIRVFPSTMQHIEPVFIGYFRLK